MSTVRKEDIDQLILDIHAAPLDEDRWPRVIEQLRHMLNAERALLFSVPLEECGAFWNVASQIDPASIKDYGREFAHEDAWMTALRNLTSPMGRSFTGEELVDRRLFLRTRFYNEFLREYGIARLLTLMMREPVAQGSAPGATLSFYRGPHSDAFGPSESETLTRVCAHLVLALETFWRLKALSIHAGTMAQTLDAVNAAVFLIDSGGRLVFENEAGAQSRRRGEVFSTEAGYLIPAAQIMEQTRLHGVLNSVRSGRSGRATLTIRPTGKQVLLCAAPLSHGINPFGGACGLLWLAHFARLSAARNVADIFDLSPAEQRLLGALCAGHSLNQAADVFQSSIHTVRSQLKAIQRKTGWRTQAEVVRQAQQLAVLDPR